MPVALEAPARCDAWSRRVANHPASDEADRTAHYCAGERTQGAIAKTLLRSGG